MRIERLDFVSILLLDTMARSQNRLPPVSKPGGETGGIEWTAGNESERRNRLHITRLEPEVRRHQPVGKGSLLEFESLPHRQLSRSSH